jgi:hypothetical protein
MRIDFHSIIIAFDACKTMRLQEIVVDGKTVRFLTTEGPYEPPLTDEEKWIKEHGSD